MDLVTIMTAADEQVARLLLDLCESLGVWRQNLCVIDIGLSANTRDALNRMKVEIILPPADCFAGARLRANYLKALYVRPRLPQLTSADIIMWIDSDCWVQREEAISAYLDSAIAFPEKFSLCATLDIEYGFCISEYWPFQKKFHEQYAAIFGQEEADWLFGKALLSSGVFAARRTSPIWEAWQAALSRVYSSEIVLERTDLSHMGELLSLNMLLHRHHAYRILENEMNWQCYFGDTTTREGALVRTRPSGRVLGIVHLVNNRVPAIADRFRANRLFYEKIDEPRAWYKTPLRGLNRMMWNPFRR